MSVVADIALTWRHPRQLMRRKLAEGVREDRVLATLMAACGLMFLAQWPALVRSATVDTTIPLQGRIGGALLAMLFLAPLAFYAVAAISRLVARPFGAAVSGYRARLALFWSLFAVSPLVLVQGLLAGLIGPGWVLNGLGALVLAVFAWTWGAAMREAFAPGVGVE